MSEKQVYEEEDDDEIIEEVCGDFEPIDLTEGVTEEVAKELIGECNDDIKTKLVNDMQSMIDSLTKMKDIVENDKDEDILDAERDFGSKIEDVHQLLIYWNSFIRKRNNVIIGYGS